MWYKANGTVVGIFLHVALLGSGMKTDLHQHVCWWSLASYSMVLISSIFALYFLHVLLIFGVCSYSSDCKSCEHLFFTSNVNCGEMLSTSYLIGCALDLLALGLSHFYNPKSVGHNGGCFHWWISQLGILPTTFIGFSFRRLFEMHVKITGKVVLEN